MDDEERLERLERRLHDVEELVLDVRAALEAATHHPGATLSQGPVAHPTSAEPPAAPSTTVRSGVPAASVAPASAPQPVQPLPRPSHLKTIGTEEWIGQRGLLAAGVFLLILAVGYFLKLAFDRGWISPLARCAGGAVFGLGVAASGWRVYQRGLRRYGATVMGAGAAIVYLAAWAAARLYELLPATVGLTSLALVAVAVFALARVIDIEALALAATLGAFMAPLLLGWEGNANALLVYSALLAAGLGWFSTRHWRLTTFVIGLSYLALGAAVAGGGTGVLMYAVAGAAAGLQVGLQRGWSETRTLAFWSGWILLVWKGDVPTLGSAVAVGGLLLASLIFWHAWRKRCVVPETDDVSLSAETLQFYVTPLGLAWAVSRLGPAWFAEQGGVLASLIALPYLIAGYARPRIPFALVGTTALGIAVMDRWESVTAVWGLLVLALLLAGLDHRLDRRDGRWYALVWVGVALLHLMTADMYPWRRGTPAFIDRWAMTLWLATVTVGVLAAGFWRRESSATDSVPASGPGPGRGRRLLSLDFGIGPTGIPALLWAAAGAMLFLGVTGEIVHAFGRAWLPPATARLAGGLAVSAWWASFAAAMVVTGFQLGARPLRVAGLGVAGLSAFKVLVIDLAQLDAFYRIGSVFMLAVVSLGVAYLYHRQAGGRAVAPEDTPAVGPGPSFSPDDGGAGDLASAAPKKSRALRARNLMALAEIDGICGGCRNQFRAAPTRSFLGFQKLRCPACSNDVLYPLTRGYRTGYWVIVVLVGPSIIADLSQGRPASSVITGLVMVLALVALVRDARIRKQVAATIVHSPS